ncbi:hypothetical protein [Nostoc sp.]|uniref:hypothetical protein n=1 Tax=Nostoc sp. TaxID=1180 RepID=UPI002FF7E332
MFYQLKVNGKDIYWERIYGTALEIQKYTKTHVSSGGNDSVSYSIEIITEFWLKEGNGRETQIKLSGADVKVREGQRVSFIWAYTKSKTSSYVIFVNHDFQDWCWVCTPTYFNYQLKVFRLLPILLWLVPLASTIPLLIIIMPIASTSISYLFFLLYVVIVSLIIIYQLIQLIKISLAWK